MKWIKPEDEAPPQGKKILYLQNGDVYVVQRIGDYWLPIPFFDSKYAFHHPPDLWADIELPHDLTGKTRIFIKKEKKLYDIDEIEVKYPHIYQDLLDQSKKLWNIK